MKIWFAVQTIDLKQIKDNTSIIINGDSLILGIFYLSDNAVFEDLYNKDNITIVCIDLGIDNSLNRQEILDFLNKVVSYKFIKCEINYKFVDYISLSCSASKVEAAK